MHTQEEVVENMSNLYSGSISPIKKTIVLNLNSERGAACEEILTSKD